MGLYIFTSTQVHGFDNQSNWQPVSRAQSLLLKTLDVSTVAKLNPLRARLPMELALTSSFCSVPVRDFNPSQVCSQQMLVLIYLPRKDRKLS